MLAAKGHSGTLAQPRLFAGERRDDRSRACSIRQLTKAVKRNSRLSLPVERFATGAALQHAVAVAEVLKGDVRRPNSCKLATNRARKENDPHALRA